MIAPGDCANRELMVAQHLPHWSLEAQQVYPRFDIPENDAEAAGEAAFASDE